MLDDAGQIIGRFGRPTNLHLRAEHLFDALAHLFMREELTVIEPLQTLAHAFTEPGVVMDVMFPKLLHVFLGRTVVLSCDALELRFQFLAELYFHGLVPFTIPIPANNKKPRPLSRAAAFLFTDFESKA